MADILCDNLSAAPFLELQVLGCSGGCAPGLRPTCFRLGKQVVIDAGAIASELSLEEQLSVRHIFLSHAHFDHLRELPLFLDNVFARSETPPVIHGLPEVLEAVRQHVFNGVIWPDISKLQPLPATYRQLSFDETLKLEDEDVEFEVRGFPSYHGVPASGYLIHILSKKRTLHNERQITDHPQSDNQQYRTASPQTDAGSNRRAVHALTTDTGFDPVFFERLADTAGLETLVIEVSFPDRLEDIAKASFHLCPKLLERGLQGVLQAHPKLRIFASHLKPHFRNEVRDELARLSLPIAILEDGQRIRLQSS